MTNLEAIQSMDKNQFIKYLGGAICERFVYKHKECILKPNGDTNCIKCLSTWFDEEVNDNV